MHISGKLLTSKVSQRIVFILFASAIIPAFLVTFLSNTTLKELVTNYEHKLLTEKARLNALNTFNNLILARNKLNDEISFEELNSDQSALRSHMMVNHIDIFQSFNIQSSNDIGQGFNVNALSNRYLQNIQPQKVYLLVLPSKDTNRLPTISLIKRTNEIAGDNTIFYAELNPSFLWGENVDYDSDISVCAYQVNKTQKTKLFCSTEFNANNANQKASLLNHASWELFLAGELNTAPWSFEINRLVPLNANDLKTTIGSKYYIAIAMLSLLIIGLLSMIQIRKTMGPLAQLIEGAKNISKGNFSKITNIEGSSEFSELANAFNGMSSHIKKQLDTLEAFSAIDKEIATKIDVEHTIELITKRIQVLQPAFIILIACLEEESESDYQFNCTVAGHEALSSIRLSFKNRELHYIKRYYEGHFAKSNLTSDYIHERLMAELGADDLWSLPIFWQGGLYAFINIGSKNPLPRDDDLWLEIRELANRLGSVISASEREQKLLLEAQYDNLTGLPNRILLQDRLKIAMNRSQQTNKPMWVVFIDLDRFKMVNDSMGHPIGDALLVEVGNRLLAETRETDTVARFGGDEFVIVLSGDSGEDIQLSVLNRIMDSIAEPIYINHHELINSCSIGISVYPNDGSNAETLIKNADIAMYRAKELGRNNYQFFTQNLNDKAAERMELISLLRRAVEFNELSLYYQPKVDLKTQQVVGFEVLLRWHNKKLGLIPPAVFIPIAEEAGLIQNISEWVLKTACQQMVIWQKSNLANVLMSVNLSPRQFLQEGLVEKIKEILIETGLKAEYLELELTETILMDTSKNILSTLHAIKSLGIQLSIDDFGTGFSNLSYLNTLPIDTLKIDKAFIDTIRLNDKKAPIVDTIINLAKNLNLKVVAEGVETAEQALYLKKQGCDQIQGYFFSKPLPSKEMRSLLASNQKLDLPQLKLIQKS